jgi:DNA repair protein RecO (recombination protein O)
VANYKTKGIILKRSNFGEADRILTIYTDNHGKIKAIGKGIRKQNSRLGGHLEPFCLADFVIAEGRNLDIVTEAEIIECFFDLRNNLKSTHISYYLAEAIDKLTAEHEKHKEVFDLLLEVLENLSFVNEDLLLSYFELNLLSEIGFHPVLKNCLQCHRPLGKINYFNLTEGGLVCNNCPENGIKISTDAIKLLRLLLEKNLQSFKKIRIPTSIQEEVRNVTQKYLDYISGQKFNSRRFLSSQY